jgi:hypothetical protein
MTHGKMLRRATASLLSIVFVSCGANRHLAPTRAEELTHLVLFIKELPDGAVTHSWQRAEDLDLAQYKSLARRLGTARRIVPAVRRPRDCDEENRDCINECMSRPLARGFGHINSGGGRGGKERFCREQCAQPYLDCVELERLRPQEFTAIDPALDWLKRHRKTILVGSVVVIAGVAFVVVSAGVGLLILAPAALLARSRG